MKARNHGLHSASHNFTIVYKCCSGTYNGISSTNLNGDYTVIGNDTLDTFTFTAQSSDEATSTGSIGGTGVTVTSNIRIRYYTVVVGLVQFSWRNGHQQL